MGHSRSSALPTGADPTLTISGPAARRRRREPTPVLGRYSLCRRLGAGGFGTVWLAWDERLEREVALKLLPRERIVSGRFEREARAAARLNHPGIVVLYEAAVDDEGGYLVSELVRGQTLGRLLEDGQLSDRDILRAAISLCDALDYAHGQGVVHRDVKPSNILLPDAPITGAEAAKLTDFGVARLVDGGSLTQTGDVVGTTAYMAPEQALGRETDGTADLYSLALVLYEALTGANPFRLHNLAVPGRRGAVHLPALRRHRRDLPRELGCAVDLALRPRQRERGTLRELRDGLAASLYGVDDEPGVMGAPRTGVLPRPSVDRRSSGGAPDQTSRSGDTRILLALGRTGQAAGWRREADHEPPSGDERRVRSAPTWSWAERGLAALAAALATAWFASGVLSPSPVLPALAVLGTALAVAALPRIGWFVLVVSGLGLLIEQDSPGGAIVLLVAVVPPVLLLLRRPARWALPAAVPALAAAGLGGLWPALAGRTSRAWERVILGAAGWLWLVVGGLLTGGVSYVRLGPGTPAPSVWMPSLYDTVHRVLDPLISSGILAPALVWGAGALVLPLISERPSGPAHDGGWIVRLGLLLGWAAAIALLTNGVLATLAPAVRMSAGETVLGAFACALVAGLSWPGARRGSARHAPTPGQDSRSMEMR
jgi:hypothetical protein